MHLLCIDPGTEKSGVVVLSSLDLKVSAIEPEILNDVLVTRIRNGHYNICDQILVEGMRGSYGTIIGGDVIKTIVWSGRFVQAWFPSPHEFVYRSEVKHLLTGTTRSKDPGVRQALIDLFPASGGGARPQIGTKTKPGPLYGVSKHAWSALGVGMAWLSKRSERPQKDLYDAITF